MTFATIWVQAPAKSVSSLTTACYTEVSNNRDSDTLQRDLDSLPVPMSRHATDNLDHDTYLGVDHQFSL